MQTVYQVGNLYISKDLVFGWCVAQDGLKYVPLQMMDIPTLNVLESINLPACIPKEFSEAIQKVKVEIADREKTSNWDQQLEEASKELQAKLVEIENLNLAVSRSRDRLILTHQIVMNMIVEEEGIFVSDLGYVKLIGLDDEWFLIQKEKTEKTEKNLNWPPITFDEAVDVILRKWW